MDDRPTVEVAFQPAGMLRTQVEKTKSFVVQLDHITSYLMTDHVGMINGAGDLSRYLRYLVRNALREVEAAETQMDLAGLPHELPF